MPRKKKIENPRPDLMKDTLIHMEIPKKVQSHNMKEQSNLPSVWDRLYSKCRVEPEVMTSRMPSQSNRKYHRDNLNAH